MRTRNTRVSLKAAQLALGERGLTPASPAQGSPLAHPAPHPLPGPKAPLFAATPYVDKTHNFSMCRLGVWGLTGSLLIPAGAGTGTVGFILFARRPSTPDPRAHAWPSCQGLAFSPPRAGLFSVAKSETLCALTPSRGFAGLATLCSGWEGKPGTQVNLKSASSLRDVPALFLGAAFSDLPG